MTRRPRDPRPPRRLRRDGDGTLYDLDERRPISLAELSEDVQAGRRFRAHRHGSERDCTQHVLLEVLGTAAPTSPGTPTGLAGRGLAAHLPALAGAASTVAGAIADRRDRADSSTRGEQARADGARRDRLRPQLSIEEDQAPSEVTAG